MKNLPQYRQLYNILREHIKTGVYAEGDLLPSENELSIVHGVTRTTVRQALLDLVHSGYIKKYKGKGSVVTSSSKEIGILSIFGTSSAFKQYDLKTRIIQKPTIQKWSDSFFYPLTETEKNSGCIQMSRIRLVNNMPVFYDLTYLPNINLPRFCTRNFENKSLFEILSREYQIEITGGNQRFSAIEADAFISKNLEIKIGSPVLYLERKIETSRNGYVFYSSLYCNTDIYLLAGRF
jgi:GntR family transcriptional regulator/GntR family frlABCD operon transcriptional regulator